MEWQKSPDDVARAFDAALPDDPRLERRKMFGFPAGFVGDTGWSPRGRAYQTGYIQGMLRALDDLSLAGVLQ